MTWHCAVADTEHVGSQLRVHKNVADISAQWHFIPVLATFGRLTLDFREI
jgi:hypothetical protein